MKNPICITSYQEIAEKLGDKIGEAFDNVIEESYHTGKISTTQKNEVYTNYNKSITDFIEKLIG